jgi:hypothetical protein
MCHSWYMSKWDIGPIKFAPLLSFSELELVAQLRVDLTVVSPIL